MNREEVPWEASFKICSVLIEHEGCEEKGYSGRLFSGDVVTELNLETHWEEVATVRDQFLQGKTCCSCSTELGVWRKKHSPGRKREDIGLSKAPQWLYCTSGEGLRWRRGITKFVLKSVMFTWRDLEDMTET